MLFADVDFEQRPSICFSVTLLLILLTITSVIGFYLQSLAAFIVLIYISFILSGFLADIVFNIMLHKTGGAEKRAKDRIVQFSEENPDWHLRLYRTPAGFRVLVMHRTFDPDSEDTQRFFKAIKSDPTYIQMCRKQNCFRARVSPKPWRIGIEARMRPRPGVLPINPARMPERKAWVAAYNNIATKFASCRFVEKFGSETCDPKA
ncbi:hypothetical protein [Desulfopila sp. IMCC35008]|uniref:hypothetical protein n=1 Tax=Desulfopila sp. IMCC35008 TaxID=2653858 RepID=UPI0013D5042E|nr:hypothetical protein [Desulfopila sp. IMCC35008]